MYDIVVNLLAGKKQGARALRTVEKSLKEKGCEYRVHQTEYPRHAEAIVRALNIAQAETNLIVLGGDGTFSEALSGIENFETVTVGFIPCGTGNDYVRAAKIPTDPAAALQRILAGKTRYADYIEHDGGRCLNVAGAGMDVDVLVRYAEMKFWKGKIKYYMSLLDTLLHLKFHRVRITTADGESVEKSVFMIAAANGTCIGGGMPISPLSDPYDGEMNVVYVNEMPKSKVLGLLLKFLKGKHIDEPCTVAFKAKEVTIEVLDDGKIEIDGEVKDEKKLHCKLVAGKLRVFEAQ